MSVPSNLEFEHPHFLGASKPLEAKQKGIGHISIRSSSQATTVVIMRPWQTAAVLLVLAGPLLASAGEDAAPSYGSIAAALKANNMKLFTEAAEKTGFITQLQSPGFIGTVFAPTDDAFQFALDAANVTKKQLFSNNTLLVDVIMYHVVPGDAIATGRLRDDGRYTSMRGKALTISKSLGGDVAVNSGSTAQVIERDLKAGAAMFNVVDNMLLPPDELSSLNLKQAQAVKFLTTIEEATGYDESLSTMYQLVQDSSLTDFFADKKTVATVFAPVDDAWYTIDQMSTYYTGNASAITSNKKALTNLLKYHIVEGKAIRASSLKDKQKLTMMNGETLTVHITDKAAKKVVEDIAKEAVIAARISGVRPNMHVILSPNTDGDEATITTADIIAGRSYLHKVDAVLVPKSMMDFLDDIATKKFGNKTAKAKGKKGNSTVSVAEALKAGNETSKNGTSKSSSIADEKSPKATYLANTTTNDAKNGTAAGSAAKSAAADVVFRMLVGLPLVLATLLVL